MDTITINEIAIHYRSKPDEEDNWDNDEFDNVDDRAVLLEPQADINETANDTEDSEEVDSRVDFKPQDDCSSDEADTTELSLDGVFQRIGYSGWFQIRFFILKLIFEIPAVYSLLPIIFVGLTPEWMCSEDKEHNDIIMMNDTNDSKCYLYEHNDDNCTPLYTDRFHSIAQEVCILPVYHGN